MASPLEVLDLIALIQEWYGADAKGNPRFNPTERVQAMWCKMLTDVPADALSAAFEQFAATQKTWSTQTPPPPSVGDLRDLALGVTQGETPTVADAWNEVMDKITRSGNWHTPTWSHELIERTVDGMGGWQVMCQMPVDETATWRAQFRDMFNAYVARADADAKLLPEVRALRDANRALPAPSEERRLIAAPTTERQASGFQVAGQVLQFGGPTRPSSPVYGNRQEYLDRMQRIQANPDGDEAKAERERADRQRRAALNIVQRAEADNG